MSSALGCVFRLGSVAACSSPTTLEVKIQYSAVRLTLQIKLFVQVEVFWVVMLYSVAVGQNFRRHT
jgi:hypothetical protein